MSGDFEERFSGSSDDKLRTPGKSTLTAAAAPATPDPGKHTHTARALPRTTSEAGVLGPASTSAHHAAPSEVAETDDDHGLNAIIKVVAYGPDGKVIARWAARAHWDGRLPITFHGAHGRGWTWSNPAARETRIQTSPDGTGGKSIEAWAQGVGATSVDVFAQAAEAVTVRKDARKDNHAPGHATEERDAGDGSTSEPGRVHTHGSEHDVAGTEAAGSDHASPTSASGDGAKKHGAGSDEHAAPTNDAEDIDDASPDPAEEQLLDEIERELAASHSPEGEGEGDADAAGGHGKRGGDPAGRTGSDTTIGGGGPGGEHAHVDGDGEGSVTGHDGNGTAAGDALGTKTGADNGRFGGEGRDGDDGVRGAGAVFGGLIAIPEALKGLVEIGLLIDAGDITGAAGDLFKKGLGKAASAAVARRVLAREARVYARKELKAIVKQVSASNAFRALAKEERARLMRIWLWETQRRYFRAYLKAAQAEQRAIRNALKRAKPGDLAALRARGATAHAGEEVALAEPVAGRLPPNHQYAGGEFPRDLLPPKYRKQGLHFTSMGRAEFEPFAMKLPNGQKQIRIKYTGSYEADKIAARKAAGFQASSLAAGPGTTPREISARCSSYRRTFTRPCDTPAAQPTTST